MFSIMLQEGVESKKAAPYAEQPKISCYRRNYRRTMPLWRLSLDTVSFLRPLLRRDANTARPLAVDMRLRKPCLFLRLVLDGWYVRLLMALSY